MICPLHIFLEALPNSLHDFFFLSMMNYLYFSGPNSVLTHLHAFIYTSVFNGNALTFLTYWWTPLLGTSISQSSLQRNLSWGPPHCFLTELCPPFSNLPQYFVLSYFLVPITMWESAHLLEPTTRPLLESLCFTGLSGPPPAIPCPGSKRLGGKQAVATWSLFSLTLQIPGPWIFPSKAPTLMPVDSWASSWMNPYKFGHSSFKGWSKPKGICWAEWTELGQAG